METRGPSLDDLLDVGDRPEPTVREAVGHSRSGRSVRTPRAARSRARKALIVVLALFGVLIVAAGGAAWYAADLMSDLNANIERFGDPFEAIPEAERPKPKPAAQGAMNILLLGSDSRVSAGDPTQWTAGAQRTDAIMMVHIPADRNGAFLVSIPRDSWVDIPGRGKAKVNAAFSYGGPALLVQTLEQLTKVRIDHVVILDFEGFVKLTDALGGVQITVPRDTGDGRQRFPAGTYSMDGETALNYVRQRYNLPGGDFDRVKRQQNWIRAVLRKLLSGGTLTNPGKLTSSLDALTSAAATDDRFTLGRMRSLAISMRGLGPADVAFFTVPVQGTGRSPDGKQSIVLLDQPRAAELWSAVADDRVADWVATHQSALLADTVR